MDLTEVSGDHSQHMELLSLSPTWKLALEYNHLFSSQNLWMQETKLWVWMVLYQLTCSLMTLATISGFLWLFASKVNMSRMIVFFFFHGFFHPFYSNCKTVWMVCIWMHVCFGELLIPHATARLEMPVHLMSVYSINCCLFATNGLDVAFEKFFTKNTRKLEMAFRTAWFS